MHVLYFVLDHGRCKEAAFVDGLPAPLNDERMRRIAHLKQFSLRHRALTRDPKDERSSEIDWNVCSALFLELLRQFQREI